MELKEFDWLSDKDSKIVIYGTTVGGKIIFQCLQAVGVNATFFCDRNGKYLEFCGIPVKQPSILGEEKNCKILIATTRSFNSVCQYLDEIGQGKVYSCINLIKIRSIEDILCDENERALVEDFYEKYPVYAGIMKNEIMFPSLEVFITERCTLKCRDCSHLIPRYLKPIDYEIDEIIDDLEKVLKVVGKISDLIILGGEPLLHKQLYRILEWGYQQEKIGTMTIISNGTVNINEDLLNVMEKTKARIRLSNYGHYSVKLKNILCKCKERNIACYVNDELWTDMGAIYNHNYSEKELKAVYKDCPFAYAFLMIRGKVFRCAHVAHLNNLGIIDSYDYDSVDIKEITDEKIDEKKKELQKYMQIDYLQGCNYCNGIKNSIQGIEPAIQGVR